MSLNVRKKGYVPAVVQQAFSRTNKSRNFNHIALQSALSEISSGSCSSAQLQADLVGSPPVNTTTTSSSSRVVAAASHAHHG